MSLGHAASPLELTASISSSSNPLSQFFPFSHEAQTQCMTYIIAASVKVNLIKSIAKHSFRPVQFMSLKTKYGSQVAFHPLDLGADCTMQYASQSCSVHIVRTISEIACK